MLDLLSLDWPEALREALAGARSYRELLRVALDQLHQQHVEIERLRAQLRALRAEFAEFRHAARPQGGPELGDKLRLPTMADSHYRHLVFAYVSGLVRDQRPA